MLLFFGRLFVEVNSESDSFLDLVYCFRFVVKCDVIFKIVKSKQVFESIYVSSWFT